MLPAVVARYRSLVTALSVLVFFTSFSQYTLRYGVAPLDWIILFGAMTVPVAAIALLTQPLRLPPLTWWCAGYLLVTTIWYFLSAQAQFNYQSVRNHYLAVIFLAFMLFLLSDAHDRLLAQRMILLGTLIGVALNVYELFHPLTFSTIPGRSTGLYANVNQSGAALVLGTIVGYGATPRRLRPLYFLVTLIGIIPTFSRGAMLGWGISVIALSVANGVRPSDIRRIALLPLIVVLFISSPFWTDLQTTLEQRGVLTQNVRDRLDFFSSRGTVLDESARERQMLAELAFQRFDMRPWLGWGTGSAWEPPFFLPPHNIYLTLMVEHGAIGIVIAPALFGLLLWGVRRESARLAVPMVIFLVVWGFFSSNQLDEFYMLVCIAFTAAAVDALRPRARLHAAPLPSAPLVTARLESAT